MSLERWHLYGTRIPFVVSATPLLFYDRVIQIQDLPGPFYARQLNISDNLGREIKCRNGRGNYFMSDFVRTDMLAGEGSVGLPFWKELEYPFNSPFRFDITQPVTEAPSPAWVQLTGAHKLADSSENLYPANFRETPYTHQVTVVCEPNQARKIPLFLRFNTPFAIRTLSAATVADGTPDFETTVVLRDHNGQSFFNRDLPWFMAFGGGNFPVTPSPELVMPPGRAFTLEVITSAGTPSSISLQFNFGGALLNVV